MKKKMPIVALVGRTNVGKSTLFNRLSVDVKSLTLDYQGVTRDFLKDTVCWQGRCFELIDTGGISLKKSNDFIMEQSRQQALSVLERADLLLFVCDGKAGLLSEDRQLAKLLHTLGKQVVLVVNKIDTLLAQEHQYEFSRLGFEPTLTVSAQHSAGIADLLEAIVERLPESTNEVVEEKTSCNVVLLGKPNVGKSSLLNLLLKQERAIVAEVPGTTREALSERITFYQEDMLITDTPGLRRKRGVTEPLEGMMVESTLQAIEEADVVVLLVDSHEGQLSDQELKLIFYAFERKHKALIILYNKEDLMDELKKGDLERSLSEYNYVLKKIEQLTISCKTQKNIGRILPLIKKVCQRYTQQLAEGRVLTDLLKEALVHKPLFHKTQALQVSWAQQVATGPITIAMRVNQPQWFGTSQLAFLEQVLRKNFDLKSVPVKFFARKKAIV